MRPRSRVTKAIMSLGGSSGHQLDVLGGGSELDGLGEMAAVDHDDPLRVEVPPESRHRRREVARRLDLRGRPPGPGERTRGRRVQRPDVEGHTQRREEAAYGFGAIAAGVLRL